MSGPAHTERCAWACLPACVVLRTPTQRGQAGLREFWKETCINATLAGADGCFSDSSQPDTHKTQTFLNASDEKVRQLSELRRRFWTPSCEFITSVPPATRHPPPATGPCDAPSQSVPPATRHPPPPPPTHVIFLLCQCFSGAEWCWRSDAAPDSGTVLVPPAGLRGREGHDDDCADRTLRGQPGPPLRGINRGASDFTRWGSGCRSRLLRFVQGGRAAPQHRCRRCSLFTGLILYSTISNDHCH